MGQVTTFNVELGERSYPIFIGSGLIGKSDLLAPYIQGKQILLVTNTLVDPLYGTTVGTALSSFDLRTAVLPDGERYKTIETVTTLFDCLLKEKFDRSCTIVALGGGVVGDIAGFAAACYQRGVNFVQIPTTLLAQVDSSVGGKTGVNHPLGKNMIGAFYQPQCVIADTDTLMSLDDRQLAAGVAEVIKYGLIRDEKFFSWVETNIEKLLSRDKEALVVAIENSCRMKAEIVASDEREAGQRALLNLGHTYGHAIEAALGYGTWLHGEAVAAGTCMAARQSRSMGWLSDREVERIESLFRRAKLPVSPPVDIEVDQFLELMAVDKKVMGGVQRLILLQGIGTSVVYSELSQKDLRKNVAAELHP